MAEIEGRAEERNMLVLKAFTKIQRLLYDKCLTGLLARCVRTKEAARVLEQTHEKSCSASDLALYIRL